MAELEVTILSSRGKVTHEPKTLRGGKNSILVGTTSIAIGASLEHGSIVLDPDARLQLVSLTDETNTVTLYPDDRSPYLALKLGEKAQITYNPDTYHSIKRQVLVTRTA